MGTIGIGGVFFRPLASYSDPYLLARHSRATAVREGADRREERKRSDVSYSAITRLFPSHYFYRITIL